VTAGDQPIVTRSSRTVYANPWLTVREDEITWPDGSPGIHAVMDKRPGALVVPYDGERITLVGMVKYPTQRFLWELPQGALDAGDDEASAEETARTELLEETGLRAGTLRHLGRIFYAPGILSQTCDVFLATDLEAGDAQPEATEVGLRTRAVTPSELDQLILAGEVADAATIAALHLVRVNGVPL
jgi:8-oxo-dGTP pyrophosphatase MutT (NUDIX family)